MTCEGSAVRVRYRPPKQTAPAYNNRLYAGAVVFHLSAQHTPAGSHPPRRNRGLHGRAVREGSLKPRSGPAPPGRPKGVPGQRRARFQQSFPPAAPEEPMQAPRARRRRSVTRQMQALHCSRNGRAAWPPCCFGIVSLLRCAVSGSRLFPLCCKPGQRIIRSSQSSVHRCICLPSSGLASAALAANHSVLSLQRD